MNLIAIPPKHTITLHEKSEHRKPNRNSQPLKPHPPKRKREKKNRIESNQNIPQILIGASSSRRLDC